MGDVGAIFLSGLGGALLGGILGLLGGYGLDLRRERAAQRAAARVLYFEAAYNALSLRMMARAELPLRHVATTTWADAQIRIAQLLSPSELNTVAKAYLTARAQSIDVALTSKASDAEARVIWAATASDFAAAAEVLRQRAWNAVERAELAAALPAPSPNLE